jgi:hypothetical protein
VARTKEPPSRISIGWREWVALPAWGIKHIKAKIDTGARTSAIHAFDIVNFDRDGQPWAQFWVHPWQDSAEDQVLVEAPLLGSRHVRSSSGSARERPVVLTVLTLAGRSVTTEVTLTRRDEMGFRMLVGREALRGVFVVDPGRSYLGGRPVHQIRRRNRGRT